MVPTGRSPIAASWTVSQSERAAGGGMCFSGRTRIVDQISFAVMRRLGLTQAFTNDNHFRAAGFETLF
jgi:predicted nucleic acid-binding protein